MKQLMLFPFMLFLLAMPACAQEKGRMQYGMRADLLRIGFNDYGRIDPYYSLKLGWDFTLKNRFGIFFGPSLKVYDGINLSLDVGLRF